jgi:hypothetical protein
MKVYLASWWVVFIPFLALLFMTGCARDPRITSAEDEAARRVGHYQNESDQLHKSERADVRQTEYEKLDALTNWSLQRVEIIVELENRRQALLAAGRPDTDPELVTLNRWIVRIKNAPPAAKAYTIGQVVDEARRIYKVRDEKRTKADTRVGEYEAALTRATRDLTQAQRLVGAVRQYDNEPEIGWEVLPALLDAVKKPPDDGTLLPPPAK